jgi:hypothetical protein
MSKFTLEFGPQSTDSLEKIAKDKGISRADVVRRALEVYSSLLGATAEDKTLILADKNGAQKEVVTI